MKIKFYNEKEGAYIGSIKLSVVIATVLSAIATCIYTVLPNSDYANSLSVPAENSLWILTLSPVFAFAGLLLYLVSFIRKYPKGKDTLRAKLVSFIYLATSVLIFGGALIYTVNQWQLGFVAPTYDTPFEAVKTAMIAAGCCQVLFGISIIKTK